MTHHPELRPASARAAAYLLIFVSLLSVAGMANHPSSFAEFTAQSRTLHGILIFCSALVFAAFAAFAQRRDLRHLPVLLGLVFLGCGSLANILAGTINGFVVPALLADGLGNEPVRALCWQLNQYLAHGAVYASGMAFLLWGTDLVLRGGGSHRLAGLLGALSGLIPMLLLATSIIDMRVGGALVAYSIQAIFGLVAAWVLLRQ